MNYFHNIVLWLITESKSNTSRNNYKQTNIKPGVVKCMGVLQSISGSFPL